MVDQSVRNPSGLITCSDFTVDVRMKKLYAVVLSCSLVVGIQGEPAAKPSKSRKSNFKRGSKDLEMLVAREPKARVAISASDALKGLEGLVGIGISFLYDQKLHRFVSFWPCKFVARHEDVTSGLARDGATNHR